MAQLDIDVDAIYSYYFLISIFFCAKTPCKMLCYVMLCYVMLCYVMLCYVMLCYILK